MQQPEAVTLYYESRKIIVKRDFVDLHPGGAEVLLQHQGQDITHVFEEVGHSIGALRLLEAFRRESSEAGEGGSGGEASGTSSPARRGKKDVGLKQRARAALMTQEDPLHVHKICGAASLVSFAVAGGKCYAGRPIFGDAWAMLAHLAPPALLSLSSLQFKVSRTRFVSALPGVALISTKQRAHHILFSWRHILACVWHFWMLERRARAVYRGAEAQASLRRLHLAGVVVISTATHVAADLITKTLARGDEEATTVRQSVKRERRGPVPEWSVAIGGRAASVSQFAATYVLALPLLLEEGESPGAAAAALRSARLAMAPLFLSLVPIQLSAFQHTLKKKNLLRPHLDMLFYIIELSAVWLALWRCQSSPRDASRGLSGAGAYLVLSNTLLLSWLRLFHGVSKYALLAANTCIFAAAARAPLLVATRWPPSLVVNLSLLSAHAAHALWDYWPRSAPPRTREAEEHLE